MIRHTRIIMGMPVTLMTPDEHVTEASLESIFSFFEYVDKKYSPFIATSDVSRINRRELTDGDYDDELREILTLTEKTKAETDGYFDVWHDGTFDPSGIVKGWAIQKASLLMKQLTPNFYVEAGGDIQTDGTNDKGHPWRIGIRNPFNRSETVAAVTLDNEAIATSGTAIRGQHIYNPHSKKPIEGIVSLSVIAPTILDADRMATAAFAMGKNGIGFIEKLKGYEGYMIDHNKMTTQTSGWQRYEA